MRSADDVSASSSAQAFLSRAEINGPPRWCGVCFNGSQRQRTTQPHDFGDCRANDRSYDRGRPTYVNSARMPTDPEHREASSLRRSQCGWSRRSFLWPGARACSVRPWQSNTHERSSLCIPFPLHHRQSSIHRVQILYLQRGGRPSPRMRARRPSGGTCGRSARICG
jgi:hypothetical protein